MLKIVADNAIPLLDKLFAVHSEIIRYCGREINQKLLKNADLLLTRSTVKIDKSLLKNTSIKLVASATVGCDHVNQAELNDMGIEFIHAPGCNANAVAEYVVAALAWHEKKGIISFDDKLTAAIIGCGQIGSKVKQKLEILGFDVIVNDPPLKLRTAKNYNFVTLKQALQADVICMHTPLTRSGDYPTYHLLDEQELSQINPEAILINAGRGEVINNNVLLQTLYKNSKLNVVLDVWENEPNINWQLFNKVNLGTPHIAGHSWRGKVMGTVMIYQQACQFFDWSPQRIDDNDFTVRLPAFEPSEELTLYDIVTQCYDIEADYKDLELQIHDKNDLQAASKFDHFRKNYYQRPEFSDLDCKNAHFKRRGLIESLGFNI